MLCLDRARLYAMSSILIILPSEGRLIKYLLQQKCFREFAQPVSKMVCIILFYFFFTLATSVNINCAGEFLSTVSGVFKHIAVCFIEALKPFIRTFA